MKSFFATVATQVPVTKSTMKKLLTFCVLMLMSLPIWADTYSNNLQVEVSREGSLYHFNATFDTSLDTCAAYKFITDYEAAKQMPGVIESVAARISSDKVRVQRVADERILFFHARMRSTLEYTEYPNQRVTFTQIAGDSKVYQGEWNIVGEAHGSKFKFTGVWEPDSMIPLFVIDHFAKNKLAQKFEFMAQLADQRKDELSAQCHRGNVVAISNSIPANVAGN